MVQTREDVVGLDSAVILASEVWQASGHLEVFVDFLNVMTASRKKPPFGIAQTGKSFRNEITPGNFIFRTREFEQMEMEFFVEPGTDEEWHDTWLKTRWDWYVDLGLNPDDMRFYEPPAETRSHYSK